jgi:hypothetical protein
VLSQVDDAKIIEPVECKLNGQSGLRVSQGDCQSGQWPEYR